MKHFVCFTLFIITATFSFSQNGCDNIQRMGSDSYYFKVRDNNANSMYCVHNQDTILDVLISRNLYRFCMKSDTCIVAKLSREWDVLKPFWNTFIASDTISMLPIGETKYIFQGDTIRRQGFKNAYVGPRFIRLKEVRKND